MIRLLVVCLVVAVGLVVWVVADPASSLNGAVLVPALVLGAVAVVCASVAERRCPR